VATGETGPLPLSTPGRRDGHATRLWPAAALHAFIARVFVTSGLKQADADAIAGLRHEAPPR
jgi:hypothetical protein